MRYALFSDIHGNIYALEAMLDALHREKIDGYLCCGDFAGYYYHTPKIIETIQLLPNFYAVRGNHDELYLKALTNEDVRYNAIKKYGNSYLNLETGVAEYLATLPQILTFQIGRYGIVMLHGSPQLPLYGRIYPDTRLEGMLLDCDFLLTGHTHYHMIRNSKENCIIVNPGSIGQPRDGKGFSYCIANFSTGEVERRCVTFDKSALMREIAQRDPEMLYLSEVLQRNERV